MDNDIILFLEENGFVPVLNNKYIKSYDLTDYMTISEGVIRFTMLDSYCEFHFSVNTAKKLIENFNELFLLFRMLYGHMGRDASFTVSKYCRRNSPVFYTPGYCSATTVTAIYLMMNNRGPVMFSDINSSHFEFDSFIKELGER